MKIQQFLHRVTVLLILCDVVTAQFMSPLNPQGFPMLDFSVPGDNRFPYSRNQNNPYGQNSLSTKTGYDSTRRVPTVIRKYSTFATQMMTPSMMKQMKNEMGGGYSDPVKSNTEKLRMSDKVIEAASVVLMEGYLLPRCRTLLKGGASEASIFQTYLAGSLCNKVSGNVLLRLFMMG